MATRYDIATGNDDYYSWQDGEGGSGTEYTTETLVAAYSNLLMPNVWHTTFIEIDTSGIPDDDEISAASLKLYLHAYTSSKGVSKTYYVVIYDGAGATSLGSFTYSAAGWVTITFPTGGEALTRINKTGKTKFYIAVEDPGETKTRTLNIRAYEYPNDQDYAAYLEVDHAPAPTATAAQVIMSCT